MSTVTIAQHTERGLMRKDFQVSLLRATRNSTWHMQNVVYSSDNCCVSLFIDTFVAAGVGTTLNPFSCFSFFRFMIFDLF